MLEDARARENLRGEPAGLLVREIKCERGRRARPGNLAHIFTVRLGWDRLSTRQRCRFLFIYYFLLPSKSFSPSGNQPAEPCGFYQW